MRKLLVLGLDGGSLDLIKRWRDQLPNFKLFLENGCYGTLRSTLPPITSPAWNCLFTGKNPAKIGLYDFFAMSFQEKEIKIVDSTHQDSPFVWQILSNHNIKVGIVNVPNTFPVQKVNGFMICGGLLSVLAKYTDYTYPSSLWKELNEEVGNYQILPLVDLTIAGKEKEYLDEFKSVLAKQISAVKYLMKRFPWNFFVYVVFVTDQAQHYFWHFMDPNHPKWNYEKSKKYENAIKDLYISVDKAIGELMEIVSNEINILIVSDHGFGPLYGYFCINEWLKEMGYLKAKFQKRTHHVKYVFMKLFTSLAKSVFAHFDRRFSRILLRIAPRDLLGKFTFRERKKYECERLLDDIDWSRTKAYGLRMGIFINVKGRDPQGIVEPGEEYEKLRDEIVNSLYKIQHPKTGKRIVTDVFKKEQIYSGKHLEWAPDLIYIVDNMSYRAIEGLEYGKLFIESPLTGDHRLEGLFMAYGPDIKKMEKEIPSVEIYDITPTILHMFGMPLSKDMDGKVLKEIFKEDSELAKKAIVYQETEHKELTRREEVFTDEDEKIIKERLRRLGYL